MAHFATLNEENKVIRVEVINNSLIIDPDGIEQEQLGIDFLSNLYGIGWYKQTSYTTRGNKHHGPDGVDEGVPFRKNYAEVGGFYSPGRDAFIPPQQYPSWTLNEDTCLWESPVTMPTDDKRYTWDEATTSWIGE